MKHSIALLIIIGVLSLVTADQNKKDQNNSYINEENLSVRFHIFTFDNRNKTIDLKNTTDSLYSICDTKNLFKFIVHGFAETWKMEYRWDWVSSMIKEMLKSDEAPKLCVIAVDWKELARGGLIANYWKAIR